MVFAIADQKVQTNVGFVCPSVVRVVKRRTGVGVGSGSVCVSGSEWERVGA